MRLISEFIFSLKQKYYEAPLIENEISFSASVFGLYKKFRNEIAALDYNHKPEEFRKLVAKNLENYNGITLPNILPSALISALLLGNLKDFLQPAEILADELHGLLQKTMEVECNRVFSGADSTTVLKIKVSEILYEYLEMEKKKVLDCIKEIYTHEQDIFTMNEEYTKKIDNLKSQRIDNYVVSVQSTHVNQQYFTFYKC